MIKLDNKGQTLIMFVILIPVLLILMALVIDIAYLYRENAKLQSTTKTVIKDLYDKKNNDNIEELVLELYKKNNINTKNLKVQTNNEYLKIINTYEIDSVFGKVIGIKKYEVKVSLKGFNDKNRLLITEE